VPDRAENIPFEPDTGNAGVGNNLFSACQVIPSLEKKDYFLGVPIIFRAEIIPSIPDTGNAGEGKVW
jgi:hypothetical protein